MVICFGACSCQYCGPHYPVEVTLSQCMYSTFVKVVYSLFVVLVSFRHRQGRKGMKVTTVELTDMTDSNSKEEQEEIEEQDTVML